MKKCFLLLFVLLLFTACSEKSLLNEPTLNNEVSFLKMPSANAKLAKTVIFSAVINGSIGGKIAINHFYFTTDWKPVFISGNLEIPANAFTGTKTISINLNDEYAFLDFKPSPYHFNLPLKLNMTYKGINLNGLNKDRVNFYYISDDGQRLELIKVQTKIFDVMNGSIGVIKAELNHFSRFGWVI